MNQVWNFFRKDVRHHWPEIAASLALLVAFAWFDIRSWGQPEGFAAATGISFLFASRFLTGFVTPLVPLSWIFLIVRVIQGESLVGDRQFWVTRPYDWKQLVAAKALFALAFINLPLFGMDVFLLARSGLHPTHYVIGLLWMQMMWILLLFLPIAALATVTRNIPQMLLAASLLVLSSVGMSAISAVIPDSNFSAGSDWTGILLLGTSLTVIAVQYARRKTVLSRWLIATLCGVLVLIMIVTPYRSLIARQYPPSNRDLPVQLSLMSPEKHDDGYRSDPEGRVPILLPLRVSGLPKDSFLELNGLIVALSNTSGLHWDSGWQPQSQDIFPDMGTVLAGFSIKRNIFDRLKSTPANTHLLLAFTLYHDQNQRQFLVPSGDFNLDGVGRCSSGIQYSNTLNCRAALRRPALLLVTLESATSTCTSIRDQTPPAPGRLARGFIRGADSAAEMGISSIRQFQIYVSDWDRSNPRLMPPGICPGTPLVISNPEAGVRRRLELQFDNLTLSDYAQTAN